MVRPLKSSVSKRIKSLPPLRCTEEEYALVQSKAQAAGMSVSSYMRRMVVQGKVVRKGYSSVSPELIRAVMQIGCDLQEVRASVEAQGGGRVAELPAELRECLQRVDMVLQEVLPA